MTPNTLDLPAKIDENGTITKTNIFFVSNYGFYDVNSVLLITNVLDESLHPYGQPTINLWYVPHGSIMIMPIVTRVNLTALNETGTIGAFLNTSNFLSQNILDVRYLFSLAGFSTALIVPFGALSPMKNITNGPAVLTGPNTANVTFAFFNFVQGYSFNVEATLSGGGIEAKGSGTYYAPSAMFFWPSLVICSIIVTSTTPIPTGSGYTLNITVTSPFGYTYTNNNVEVISP